MKTIEVINMKTRKMDIFLEIHSYKFNGDTLVLMKTSEEVLRTYHAYQFTGFKVNVRTDRKTG